MFPGAGASVYYNEAGEPTGWDYPTDDADSFYCDICGFNHDGGCPTDIEDEDDEPEDDEDVDLPGPISMDDPWWSGSRSDW